MTFCCCEFADINQKKQLHLHFRLSLLLKQTHDIKLFEKLLYHMCSLQRKNINESYFLSQGVQLSLFDKVSLNDKQTADASVFCASGCYQINSLQANIFQAVKNTYKISFSNILVNKQYFRVFHNYSFRRFRVEFHFFIKITAG